MKIQFCLGALFLAGCTPEPQAHWMQRSMKTSVDERGPDNIPECSKRVVKTEQHSHTTLEQHREFERMELDDGRIWIFSHKDGYFKCIVGRRDHQSLFGLVHLQYQQRRRKLRG